MSDRLSEMFAALADPTRRDMVARLSVGDATVGQLAAHYAMSIQAVSKHLKVLTAAGLVSKTSQAQRRLVHLEVEAFDELIGWIDRYQRAARQRLDRLDAVLSALPDDASATTDRIPNRND